MYVQLINRSVILKGYGLHVGATYPSTSQAAVAYSFLWECCDRFNKEPALDAKYGADPKIYVYGEMYRPTEFMTKFAHYAEKIGALVSVTSEEIKEPTLNG